MTYFEEPSELPEELKNIDEIEMIENFNIINLNKDYNKKLLREQIRTEHLNSEEKDKLMNLIKKYKSIFYDEESDLSFTNVIKHRIRTVNESPIFCRTYRYPTIHKQEIQTQIDEMLEKGIIRHSYSPYSAPIWIVPKKADASGKTKWRLVVDYRKLNEVTIDDRYPIPNIEDILGKLGRCQYFTTLDLARGFHQIEIDERDIQKTAFSVENGHYEFLRMPFGLKTAPATFQRLMNYVLREYINKICLVYLDDIIIFSTSLDEHLDSLTKIFDRLKQVNLTVQLDKSEFLKKETEFLGHIVTLNGIKPNPNKVKCIKDFPIPKTQKQIKQFLGLTGYYRKFIRDYSKIAKPMTNYLKKNSKLNINDPKYIDSFETLKTLLMNDPILKYPDFKETFTITTDASQFALGAILSQNNHPICYASRTLNDHEINYSTIEKELLAVVWATKYFRPYVFGRKFIIETDHKPLQWLFSIKEPNSKLIRWRLKLLEYDYEIKYKRGIQNGNADALSRIEVNAIENEIESPGIIITNSSVNTFKNQLIIYKIQSGSLRIRNQNIFDKKRKIIQLKTLDYQTALNILKNHTNPKTTNGLYINDNDFFETLQRVYIENFTAGNFKIIRSKKLLEDITDEENLAKIIEKEHLRNNHRGINEVHKQLQEIYYHPKLLTRITLFINNCEICNAEKYERRPIKPKFEITETPSHPNEIIHCDVFYTIQNTMFLTFIDTFTKFGQAIRINSRNWVEFKRALLQYISAVGRFENLIMDNELGFKAIPLREFLNNENINIHFTSSSNKTSNSDIERLHNTINEHLRLLRHDPLKDTDTVEEKLFKIINYYNNTIHSTTNIRPIDFKNGKIKDEEYPAIKAKIEERKRKIIEKLNEKRDEIIIEEETPIFIKDTRGGKIHAKFRKIDAEILDNKHIIDKTSKVKYFKNHIKKKKKFQNYKNPTIKIKIKKSKRLPISGQNEITNNQNAIPSTSSNPD
jgi:hypothetical protein